jgi:hypothetical protein
MCRTDRDSVPGANLPHVLDPLKALNAPEVCGRHVLIVDDNGDYLPLVWRACLSNWAASLP